MTQNLSLSILIAEDEPSLADLYRTWLEPDYDVQVAADGREALDLLDDTIDVLLLDREMPRLNGDGIVEALQDSAYSCRVAMLTAVEPDFDILELGCDDYLVKPVRRGELEQLVISLAKRAAYDECFQDYFALISKKAVLEIQKNPSELTASPEYTDLLDDIRALEQKLDTTIGELADDEFTGLFHDIDSVDAKPLQDQ